MTVPAIATAPATEEVTATVPATVLAPATVPVASGAQPGLVTTRTPRLPATRNQKKRYQTPAMVASPTLQQQGQHRMAGSSTLVPAGDLVGSHHMVNPFRGIGGQVPDLLTVPAGVPAEREEYGLPLSTQLRGAQQGVLVLASSRCQA